MWFVGVFLYAKMDDVEVKELLYIRGRDANS